MDENDGLGGVGGTVPMTARGEGMLDDGVWSIVLMMEGEAADTLCANLGSFGMERGGGGGG
jgi:hypothetical protein